MNLLISCVGAYEDSGIGSGGLVLYNNTKVKIIDKIDTTGLIKYNSKVFRFIRSQQLLIGYDQKGVFYKCSFSEVRDCHDIYIKDEKIFFVSTSTNTLLEYSFIGDLISKKKFRGNNDAWHVNCVEEINENIFITAFGDFEYHREWNEKGCFERGFLYDINSEKIIISKLSGPHTPRYIDGKWFICNSHTKSLRIYNNDIEYTEINLGGFTRGFTFDDNFLYVGVSSNRKKKNSNESLIKVLDRKTFSLIKEIKIPFPEIYDIIICETEIVKGIEKDINSFLLYTNDSRINSLTMQLEQTEKEFNKLYKKIKKNKKKSILERVKRKLFL